MSLITATLADLATKAQASVAWSPSVSPQAPAAESPSHPVLFAQHAHLFIGSSRPTRAQRARLSLAMTPRANEHLAVLLPKNLWKVSALVQLRATPSHLRQPDTLAFICDNFYCRVKFTVLERRHVRFRPYVVLRIKLICPVALQKVRWCILPPLYLPAYSPPGCLKP